MPLTPQEARRRVTEITEEDRETIDRTITEIDHTILAHYANYPGSDQVIFEMGRLASLTESKLGVVREELSEKYGKVGWHVTYNTTYDPTEPSYIRKIAVVLKERGEQ